MAYTTFEKYRQDYEVAHLASQAVHGVSSQTKMVDPSVGWNLYTRAVKPALGFQTFGRHITGGKAKELMEFRRESPTGDLPAHLVGMNHSEKFFKNFGIVNDADEGSILLMGGGKWNFTINDTWLLAGVHAKLPFYPASLIHRGNIYHTKYLLTITGRELLGLALFGYREVKGHASIGSAYECKQPAKAAAARLTDYQTGVGGIKSMQDAAAVFKDAGFEIL